MYELNTERSIIKIFDGQTGKEAAFEAVDVDSDLLIKYQSELIDLMTKKRDTAEIFEFKLKWAQKIITGISGNYFTVDGSPISSDKNSENYYPEWFAIIKRKRSDLLLKIVDHKFGSTNFVLKEEQIPFVKSSVN